ncbi:unnamed protein product [Alopecurus aequalis]
MSMGRLAQMLITLTILLLHTSLQAEGAIGTDTTETIPTQSVKLVGMKQESIVRTCRPCTCDNGTVTNCCTQAHCNAPGESLGSCSFIKITCGCDASTCK